MDVAVVHNDMAGTKGPDELDVLVQAKVVKEALKELGHRASNVVCTLDLREVRRRMEMSVPDVVFNLVEALDGHGRLIHLFPFLLDALGMPYTGSPAEAILATSHKVMAKERMKAAGVPTPEWIGPHPGGIGGSTGIPGGNVSKTTWIIKSLWEHASVGINETSIVEGQTAEDIVALLRLKADGLGGACFAERFIEGREFNISVIAGPGGPVILPPAEIIFEDYDETMPRIVDYRAKWDETSFAFQHTPRQFDFAPADEALLHAIKALTLDCWKIFGLSGYGRVDFRVDSQRQPWILEVNTNPCLSPEAGFAAALKQGGLTFTEAVEHILEDAFSGNPRRTGHCRENHPGRGCGSAGTA
jgi:D-alanine-D-alanine ligase